MDLKRFSTSGFGAIVAVAVVILGLLFATGLVAPGGAWVWALIVALGVARLT